MNLEKRFIAIKDFLIEHQILHELEALDRYPFSNTPYNKWVEELMTLDDEELIRLENTFDTKNIKLQAYIDFLEQVSVLSKIPTKEFKTEEIPLRLSRKLSKKKQHEIKIINSQFNQLDIENYIDIGSGAGHLSSVLLHENSKISTCIDLDRNFQEIGINKLKKYAPEILKRMKFTQKEINKDFKIPFQEKTGLIGLHACGNLSVTLIKLFQSSKLPYLLSYGCCYHKLDFEHLNISKLSKIGTQLSLSNHALTMAAKSYKELTLEEFNDRKRVKNYRYTIHLLMQEKLNISFRALGNAKKSDYQEDFATYAKKYLEETMTYSDIELNDYYLSKKIEVKKIICFGVLRSHLSRLIEIYIILDRAIYLVECGKNVEIIETFDRKLSPRNISIVGMS